MRNSLNMVTSRSHSVGATCAGSSTRSRCRPPAPIVTQALVRIAALYAIDADIRGLSADECRQARQRRTKPLLDDLRLRLEAQVAAVSGKATIAGAIRYTLSRWNGLICCLQLGPVDTGTGLPAEGRPRWPHYY
jgi:hypothetical protein